MVDMERRRPAIIRRAMRHEFRLWNCGIAHKVYPQLKAQIDKQAREAAAEVLRIRPGFTITWFLGQIKLAKPEDEERLRSGLLLAGLPP